VLERSMVKNGQSRRTVAQATAALCIGGMVVARTVVDRNVADELREACTAVALGLGGWAKHRKIRNESPSCGYRGPRRGSHRD